MNAQRRWTIDVLLVGLPLLGGAIVLILFHWSFSNGVLFSKSNKAPVSSALTLPRAQQATGDLRQLMSQSSGSESNVLILPKASLDFVGEWGGYTHSTIHSVVPGQLTGRNPDRVSVVFGRSGNTVFIGSELYGAPSQRLLRKPTVRIASPGEALIEYASEDKELHYLYTHSFRLRASGRIAYREKVYVHERGTNRFVGFVEQRATLKRLLTADAKTLFARPSVDQVPLRDVSAHRSFSPANSDKQGRAR